jgi:hypothetical protein
MGKIHTMLNDKIVSLSDLVRLRAPDMTGDAQMVQMTGVRPAWTIRLLVKRARFVELLTALTVCLAFSSPSHAYLDPGTGSIILQSALAGIAVAMGVLRLYWHRFKAFVANLTGGPSRPARRQEQELAPDSDVQNEP